MRKIITFLGVIALLVSCKQEVIDKPEQLIERDVMVDIMYDLSILEAMKYQNPTTLDTFKINPREYILKTLVENYAVKVDPVLHAEVLERYKKLNLAPYKGFVNPKYELVTDDNGNITDVTVDYSEGYVEQMLRYSKDYSPLPSVNN